jgi:hypothetical protein
MQRIWQVDSAAAMILKSNPPMVGVTAIGKVLTSGWRNPRLDPFYYVVPPADGIQDYSFDAEPPHGIVLPVITPIAAHAIIARDPNDYWGDGKPLRGIRIHARENSIVAELHEPSHELKADITGPYPWPWPWQTEGVHLTGGSEPFPVAMASGFLAGMALRVYHTGDMLTKDYRIDRFNVELSRETERIVRAWIG